jgi:hypothetical protein
MSAARTPDEKHSGRRFLAGQNRQKIPADHTSAIYLIAGQMHGPPIFVFA